VNTLNTVQPSHGNSAISEADRVFAYDRHVTDRAFTFRNVEVTVGLMEQIPLILFAMGFEDAQAVDTLEAAARTVTLSGAES
jgi:hypothetical protein